MVKLKGPGLAAGAAGQLGGQLIFSNWKATAYLKKHRRPKQPRTAKQISMRAVLAFLSSEWSGLSDADKATWLDLAAARNIPPSNAYLAYNLERWRRFKFPSTAHPATETDGSTYLTDLYATGGVRHARVGLTITNPRDGWGLFLHRNLGGQFDPTWDNCIAVLNATSLGQIEHLDTPLAAGFYTYTWSRSTKYGSDRLATSQVNCNVTD